MNLPIAVTTDIAERMGRSEPSLVHGGSSKDRKSNDIADGIDMRNRRLKVFIRQQKPTPVSFEPNRFQTETLSIALSPRGVEHAL
jgi:hypothetical protein